MIAGGDKSRNLLCKLKRRFFCVHYTNSPKRGSLELALCQYSKRENVQAGMRKCKGFLFLRHITKVERMDTDVTTADNPFLAGPPVVNTLDATAGKKFKRDQVRCTRNRYFAILSVQVSTGLPSHHNFFFFCPLLSLQIHIQQANSVHGIQIHSPHMNLFLVAVSEEHLQYFIAGLCSISGLDIPKGISWAVDLHGKHHHSSLSKLCLPNQQNMTAFLLSISRSNSRSTRIPEAVSRHFSKETTVVWTSEGQRRVVENP